MVMTGGSAGFGAMAAERIARADGSRLLIGARRPTDLGEWLSLDLSELDSVRSFADSVRERLGDNAIGALVLNAGMVRYDASGRTADGFETTFAVNHLAHYLLLRLLLPLLAEEATVVLTTSGTHDPATRAGLATPRHVDADLLARPDRDPGRDLRPKQAGQQAYTASKLCAILTVRSLSRRHGRLTAIAYCPGQVFGTGLARSLPAPMRAAWTLLGTPLGWPLRRLNRFLNTREDAGRALAELVLGQAAPPPGRTYAALRRGRLTWPDPSDLALDDDAAETLWTDSARLVGLPD